MNTKPICAYCQSSEIVADASAIWDIATQLWKINDIYDKGHYCTACECETGIDWIDL